MSMQALDTSTIVDSPSADLQTVHSTRGRSTYYVVGRILAQGRSTMCHRQARVSCTSCMEPWKPPPQAAHQPARRCGTWQTSIPNPDERHRENGILSVSELPRSNLAVQLVPGRGRYSRYGWAGVPTRSGFSCAMSTLIGIVVVANATISLPNTVRRVVTFCRRRDHDDAMFG